MLFKYKIQKFVDGNGEEKFRAMYKSTKWFSWIWQQVGSSHNYIADAQQRIEKELVVDRKTKREQLSRKKKVVKEYNYVMIPNHVPKEQHEKFIDLSGVNK